jgi:hypothetical protein
LNVGLDHLSWVESGESGGALDDQLHDADFLCIEAILDYLSDIAVLLTTGTTPEGYFATQKKHSVIRATHYHLIAGQLYKLGLDSILRRCVLDHERLDILCECHGGVVRGRVGGKATVQRILRVGL